jgi:(5-formylfuran-3-yl)methyl phosphate synthase
MPKLLISVRSIEEARLALDAGVDVIDVKEPLAGALGAASPAVIGEIVRLVDGQCLTSFACGELLQSAADVLRQVHQLAQDTSSAPARAADFVKVGLAGCRSLDDWPTPWRRFLSLVPNRCAQQASYVGCSAVLIDTFDKRGDGLLRLHPLDTVTAWINEIHSRNMQVAVAGRLALDDVVRVAPLGADYVAARGAVCSPDRLGSLDQKRLQRLRLLLAAQKSALPAS